MRGVMNLDEHAIHDRPMRRAVIVVDCQNDFCEGGELAVDGGADAVAGIADWLLSKENDDALIVATFDHHVSPGSHFSDRPDFVDSWPPHCVAGTHGAQLHANLATAEHLIQERFLKGATQAAYSGFEGRATGDGRLLADYLRSYDISAVDVVGLATDYCVAATCRSALLEGLEVRVLSSLCASVHPDNEAEVLRGLAHAGVNVDPNR
jgi:nicotinamidase/pyrazinamidase